MILTMLIKRRIIVVQRQVVKQKEVNRVRKKVVQKTKRGVNMTEERRKEIKEIVVNLQQMSRESLILVKNAADVLKIRDSMEKKAG